MKFSHSITLNASPEWREHYLAYSHLKKLIYAIEKATLGLDQLPVDHHDLENGTLPPAHIYQGASLETPQADSIRDEAPSEQTPLLPAGMESVTAVGKLSLQDANDFFERALDEELDKIKNFYTEKELDLLADVQALINEIRSVEKYEESYLVGLSDAFDSSQVPSLHLMSPALPPPQVGLESVREEPLSYSIACGSNPSAASATTTMAFLGSTVDATKTSPTSSASESMMEDLSQSKPSLIKRATTIGPILHSSNPNISLQSSVSPNATDRRRVYSENFDDAIGMTPDASRPGYLTFLIWSSKGLRNHRQRFQKRVIGLFVVLCELRDYVDIHETGFSKVLKKYEKVVGAKLKHSYMAKVELSYPFLNRTKEALAKIIDRVIGIYARIATDGKAGLALTELKSHLRDHIVWERNTIWRDMIEQERRRETIGLRPNAMTGDALGLSKFVPIKIGTITLYLPNVIPANFLVILLATAVLIGIIQYRVLPTPEQNGCFAILIFASILWAFEALPLFITSILVPLLVVVLRVQRKNGERLSAHDAAKQIFSDMFGPVIMLLLGGFSLAGALSKHNIAKEAAAIILGRAGSKPQWVLLANMFVSTFSSMWISNVAAPVLCFSLVSPILRNLPHKSRYARCLVMGIAMAANVGGMASPISSPQNIIAMANMNPPPSWLQWFTIAIPICLVIDTCIWALLLLVYKPDEGAAPPELYGQEHFSSRKMSCTQIYILCVTVATIGLWCAESSIEGIVGDMGVIAIIPIVAFYGTGILTKDDWNSMLWSVVMLAMGGIALGKAVDSSGLLAFITDIFSPYLEELPLLYSIALLTGVVVIITSFISHTVGALIILPVVAQIGASLSDPRPRTLVMAAALLCSGGMALPVSSFPNMNAISLEDPTGVPWLRVVDFLQIGILSTGIAWLSVMSIGYTIMTVIEFG
ncbi:hypothetical protein BDV3_001507 [Batrachochytrium dendrobatidis]|uniref:SPX domain-containing protein n=1 Tax=Batrachochytrium dendrobatidis (strain JEL423) TaxID=403673 RepID=A0A177WAX3_BATDL|nr:low-affinity phosphate transporter [Batrachochytrium dendrobatidis]KAK5668326.1 low-affinity phosphate transporter [Batrachochytrium dendrobatidis]OAJ36936.1 hypothetical protein BDEG_21035 [Batrachochytrium dendrobatidis JEL423]